MTASIILLFTNDPADGDRWSEGEPFVNMSAFLATQDMQNWLDARAGTLTSIGIVLGEGDEENDQGELVLHRTSDAWECLLVLPTSTERLAHGSWAACRTHFCNVAVQPGSHWLML